MPALTGSTATSGSGTLTASITHPLVGKRATTTSGVVSTSTLAPTSATASVQITNDGYRNVTCLFTGTVTNDVLAPMVVLDPALLNNDPLTGSNRLRVDTIDYIVDDGLTITLAWQASPSVSFLDLAGRGTIKVGLTQGGLQNKTAGSTGRIVAWSDSPVGPATNYDYSIEVKCVKQMQ